jgi:uncharacterized protein
MSRSLASTFVGSSARWLAVGAVAGLLVAGAAGPLVGPRTALAVDPAVTPEHTITVNGVGTVTLAPDTADLRIGVNIIRPTATQARADAATAMTKVVAAIKNAGIADKDIQTSALSLQPVYDYGNGSGPATLTGFLVSNIVSITSHDLDKVGGLVDAAVAGGATSIDGISFRVDDQTKAESQARVAAVADAKAKADALAGAANVSIVGVSSIAETSAPMPYPIAYAAGAATKDASTPIQVGSTDVTVTVTIVYRIG